jgi:hypothetical protein
MTVFGEIEQFITEQLYPYRWPILIGIGLAVAGALWFGYRQRWYRNIQRYPVQSAAVAVVAVSVLAYPVYYLGSPLVSGGKTVCEASPIAGAGAGSERCQGVAQAAERPSSTADAPGAVAIDGASTPTAPPVTGFQAGVVAEGTFEGADDFHFGRGQALLIEESPGEYVLRFENFEVRNGPDLFVYLLTDAEGYSGGASELGELKGTKGAFNYDVPEGTDASRFKSAVVWCKAFGVLFAAAPFTEM